ncbi:MAG: NAD-dependent epimerase/dehydratase family protein [Deltaproteobacteria bacterium]|nr:MAG: NAD-dependent epimerase/dehydratase family protein [Deltaproteobacteria bacterium]
MKVVVTGVSGKMGRIVARELAGAGHRVVGIDVRPWPDPPPGIEVVLADIRKRPAEDVFRRERPDALVHMATVTYLTHGREARSRINLVGTQAVLEHAHTHGVGRVIFVGRHTYYGAAPDAPLYHTEEDPPLAVHTYPELADLVAADLYAASALWRHPEIDTCILRIVYVLGPSGHGPLASYLSARRVPTVLGYDPLFQVMHERDAARAVASALEHGLRGVFNVSGPAPIPLSVLIEEAGRPAVPVPEPILPRLLGRFGFSRLPRGAVVHLQHPVVVDGRRFRDATGFRYEYDLPETIAAFRGAFPPEGAAT